MHAKLAILKRITKLYEAVEEVHSAELKRMTAALREAQSAVDAELRAAHSTTCEGRKALASGDPVGRAAAELQRRAAAVKRHRLEAVRIERERSSGSAREQYVVSRRKSQQMQRLSACAAEQMAVQEERKLQAATDDRFLARHRWKSVLNERSGPGRMKAS